MRKKKQEKILLEKVFIEKPIAEGRCLAHYQDRVILVEGNVAPQDIADLEVFKKKSNYWLARAVRIHEASPFRQEPFCRHYGVCGGCKWQHLQYEKQLEQKQQEVVDALERIAKVAFPEVKPIIASQKTQFYRNKLEFTFSNNRWLSAEEIATGQVFEKNALGFHIPERFDKIIDIETCYLQEELSNQIRNRLKDFARKQNFSFYDLKNHRGFLRNLVIRNTNTGEWLVLVIFAENNQPAIEQTMQFLQNSFPQITSLQYAINQKKNDSYHDLEIQFFAGKPYITATMEDLQFRISPKSFYQTNSEQAYRLYCVARDFAELQGNEVVYDLYTGTGTIANFIANKAKKVVGIEYVPEAIEDAKINSDINKISNTEFFAGDIKDLLNENFVQKHGKPDVIITDPPRAGMHENVVRTILKLAPTKIVYVSCNPATQARDVAILAEKYEITAVQPVDMFPHTYHVENVLQLIRRY
ncbi:23S rRNA (uracil(1939)-C(5))-methyltransferase RlmD [Raineya orbicola]|uniref:RumA: 23S rRNA (Uracil-5-)-methyltransferase RumA n=1 Tax=Raineya orbicola TaxID=2016530 RepID=A0A2N3IID2_9BACT|nr:23S rRNA (uracil(1939)-C(5))-methyltransferase RlmD [Raineya orbicola]PKQ70099.1 rumA: 23S rRNA (uracil-5-)-methyltransferase RumA [Raineya orbicola]